MIPRFFALNFETNCRFFWKNSRWVFKQGTVSNAAIAFLQLQEKSRVFSVKMSIIHKPKELRREINGVRIRLRSISYDDILYYFEAFNTEDIVQFWENRIRWEWSYLLYRFEVWVKRENENKLSWWSIFLRNETFVGSIGLNDTGGTLQICIFILEKYRKSWIASEALATILKYLKKNKKITPEVTIEFTVHRENNDSIELAKKFGFTEKRESQNIAGMPNFRFSKIVDAYKMNLVFSDQLSSLKRNLTSPPRTIIPNYLQKTFLLPSSPIHYIKSIDILSPKVVVGSPFTVCLKFTDYAQSIDLNGHFIVVQMFNDYSQNCEFICRKSKDVPTTYLMYHVPSKRRTYRFLGDSVTFEVTTPKIYEKNGGIKLQLIWVARDTIETVVTHIFPQSRKKNLKNDTNPSHLSLDHLPLPIVNNCNNINNINNILIQSPDFILNNNEFNHVNYYNNNNNNDNNNNNNNTIVIEFDIMEEEYKLEHIRNFGDDNNISYNDSPFVGGGTVGINHLT